MDIKKTFPNGFIKEEVYIEKPKGFETLIRSLMCAQSSKNCMVSNNHPVLGTPGSIVISPIR